MDEEGYFLKSFYRTKGDDYFEGDLIHLIDGLTSAELEMENIKLQAKDMQLEVGGDESNVVETFEKVYHSNGQVASSSFSVRTEHGLNRAFCIQFGKKAPAVGEFGESLYLSDNDLLRKVFYYGYNGPEPIKTMDSDFFVETATAASMSRGWEMKESASMLASEFIDEITNLESPPQEFQVWIMETNEGETQELAYSIWSISEQVQKLPSMESEAIDGKTRTHAGILDTVTQVEDTVAIIDLMVGERYTLYGYLVDKSTGEAILIDEKKIESVVDFEASLEEQVIVNEFDFDGSSLDDIEVVVYEYLYDSEGELIVTDADSGNALQTVSYTAKEEEYVYVEENDDPPEELTEVDEVIETEEIKVSQPKTGDGSKILKYILLGILSCIGVVLSNKNKRIYRL